MHSARFTRSIHCIGDSACKARPRPTRETVPARTSERCWSGGQAMTNEECMLHTLHIYHPVLAPEQLVALYRRLPACPPCPLARQLIKIHRSQVTTAEGCHGLFSSSCISDQWARAVGWRSGKRTLWRCGGRPQRRSGGASRSMRSSFRIYQSLAVPFIRGNPIPVPLPFKDSAGMEEER